MQKSMHYKAVFIVGLILTSLKKDDMVINYIFTDWSAADAKQRPEYPQARVLTQRIPLLSIDDTQAYVEAKLTQLDMYKDAPEDAIPLCTDEDLWRKETTWKYYKTKDKTDGRSTKNFDNSADAYARLADDGLHRYCFRSERSSGSLSLLLCFLCMYTKR